MSKLEAIEELDLLIDAAHTCSEDWTEVEWSNHNAEMASLNAIVNGD